MRKLKHIIPTLGSPWPQCRPGLCLDFATDFVAINTLCKPELSTSTWQTHVSSCQLLITTLSCYCHPQVSKQFLCVPHTAKWGTAAIWEVQAQAAMEGVQYRRAPSQFGDSAPDSLQASEPDEIQASAHTAVCPECTHSGSTACTQNQRGL